MPRTMNPDQLSHASHKAKDDSRGGARRSHSSQPRSVLISKALSRLLRHQAENSGVPISQDGWVRLDHVLAWKGLGGKSGLSGSPVTVEDVWVVVEENEKKRFAVRLAVDGEEGIQAGQDGDVEGMASGSESDSETACAIASFRDSASPPPASTFLIRATQGHSIKTISSDTGLLTPIVLSDPSSIPSTCVHGTFYGSWPAILSSGGLKRMGRNHVHFAEGPTLAEQGLNARGERVDGGVIGERMEVVSGMRRDAQLLVYVDMKKALEGEKRMVWWRSENGVVLTEGAEVLARDGEGDTTVDDEGGSIDIKVDSSSVAPVITETVEKDVKDLSLQDRKPRVQQLKGKQAQAAAQSDKMVSMDYWTVVVDIRGGRGVIWRQGEGVIQELPESLTERGPPKGRGRSGGRGGHRGRGRQSG